MKLVEPKVFLIGETRAVEEEISSYLQHIGVPEWKSDAPSDAEKIIEIMGRLCYKSFKPGLNPNVVKVREHNDEYVGNIVKVKHGSVIEHGFLNFIFADVSRVFTHELIRHRVGRGYEDRDELRDTSLYEFITLGPAVESDMTEGTAVSQESLRFVRFDNIGFWVPSVIAGNEEALRIFIEKIGLDEEYQIKLTKALKIEIMTSFDEKKKATSAMRRIVGMGVATSVGWSANLRTIRHTIEMRTSPHSEEEIRLVFAQVAEKVNSRYPNIFADYTVEIVDNLPWYKTEHAKV